MVIAHARRRGAHDSRGSRRRPVAAAGAVAALVVGLLAAVSTVGAPVPAAAAPGDAFDPAAPVVFIAQNSPSQLQRAQTIGDGSFVFSDEGGAAPVGYNAIGFNEADDFIYAMVSGNATPGLPLGSLVRVGEGGTVTRVGTSVYTHPATGSTRFFSGAFNPADGLYYISDSGPNTTVHAIDVATGDVVDTIDLGVQPGVQDFAFADGFAWGANNAGDLRRIDVQAGSVTVFPGVMPPTTGGYGGVWNFGNGNLGFSANATGDVVQLEITDGAAAVPGFTIVSTVPGPGSDFNDGTAIPGRPVDLDIDKTTPATHEPGARVSYGIMVTNNGTGASSGWTVTDTLPAGLSNPAVVGDFTVELSGSTLTVSGGRLAPGESATFQIEADSGAPVDTCLSNTATVLGNEDDPVTGNDSATAVTCVVAVPVASFSLKKSVEPEMAAPGDVVTYDIAVANTGEIAYTDDDPASFIDDLSGVLDDAVYNDDVSAGGAIDGDLLTWSGPLEVGETLQVTYSVTVDDPVGGDFSLRNTVAPAATGGVCVDGGCGTDTAVSAYSVEKRADVQSVVGGGVVTYQVTVTNTGRSAYTAEAPASFVDDLSGVLDDATYNGDATAGAVVIGDELSWSGALGVGESVTVTYSVTVDRPENGDRMLRNTVAADGPGGACADPAACLVETPVADFQVRKQVSAERASVGDTVHFTVTVTNTGAVPFTSDVPASFTDDLTDALRFGTYDGFASGGATYDEPVLSWSGALGVGETATVSYSVTLNRVGEFRNVVTTPSGSGGNCVLGSTDEDCGTVTTVSPPGLAVTGGPLWMGGGLCGALLMGAGLWLAVRRRVGQKE
ncbi:hypothetical protein RS83_01232 [Microbacterium oxydans]|uniref:DUF11 domain-containing protein n=1 Tax=Microbacterium oxydans TaxID=82380 RepID=A0A0F0LCT9_9MICO|nr:hypothetical protein RS83_01232 [Microbacterium oxydans]